MPFADLENWVRGKPRRRPADAVPAAPAARGGSPWLFASGSGTPLTGGWTDSRTEQVRHFKHWVYVAVARIAEAVAQAIPHLSVARDASRPDVMGDPERWLPPRVRARALAPLQSHEELEPAPADHPLARLLRAPNPYDTPFDLWYETVMYLSLTGNGYWWCPPNAAGLPAEVWCLPSHWVWPVAGASRLVEAYQVRPVEGAHVGAVLPAADVVHFRRKNPMSKVDGYSPQTAAAQWIDASDSIDRARWHVFKNGPMPQLKVEFTELNPTEELLNRIEARIQNRYAGEYNAARPMLVPKGATVAPLWITPKELDFRSSFEQIRDSILAAFGVPAVVAGITKNMTFGSVLAAQAGFCKFAVNPLLSFLGDGITHHLARRYDEKLRVWWPDQSPDDPAARSRDLTNEILAGAVSVNEIRAANGRKPRPEPEADALVPSPNVAARGGAGPKAAGKAVRRAAGGFPPNSTPGDA